MKRCKYTSVNISKCQMAHQVITTTLPHQRGVQSMSHRVMQPLLNQQPGKMGSVNLVVPPSQSRQTAICWQGGILIQLVVSPCMALYSVLMQRRLKDISLHPRPPFQSHFRPTPLYATVMLTSPFHSTSQ